MTIWSKIIDLIEIKLLICSPPLGVIELHIVHFEAFSILCFIEDTLSIHSESFKINMINIVVTNKSY